MIATSARAEQTQIDSSNKEYWNTLCGSQLAQVLGITDASRESLKKYDDYYLGFYHYLLPHIDYESLRGKRVLEIGLGYGTLSQKIAEIASDYQGLDIAQGPVDMVNDRLKMHGLNGKAQQGSILNPPFELASFDAIISIGCLHHTGSFWDGVTQVEKLLKPGGTMAVMVYNAFSYRRWMSFTKPTLRQYINELFGLRRSITTTQEERSAYDQGAPETAFYSAAEVRRNLRARWKKIIITRDNAQPEGRFLDWTRERMLKYVAPLWGLDLYIRATKR